MNKNVNKILHKTLKGINIFVLASKKEILNSRKKLNNLLNKEFVKDYIEYERYCK